MSEATDRIEKSRPRRFRPYPEYKNSGIQWFREIPAHWQVGRLKDHGALVGGVGFPHDHQGNTDEVLPFYKVGDLSASSDGRYMGQARHTVSFEIAAELRAQVIPGNSIIYAKIGAALLLNRRRITTMPCCIDNNMTAYVPRLGQLTSEWAFYWTSIIDFAALAHPGAVPWLSEGDQADIQVPIPPIAEQRAIAAFLDWETAKVDALVAKKKRLIELLQEKRSALITRAVTQGLDPDVPMKDSGVEWLGEFPAHWGLIPLGRLIRHIEQGWSPIAEDRPAARDEWGVIKLSAVSRGRFRQQEHKALPSRVRPDARYEIREDDFLLTRSNTPDRVGDVCVVGAVRNQLMLCDLVYRLNLVRNKVDGNFLTYWFLSRTGRHQIRVEARGSSQSMVKVSQRIIRAWAVAMPALDEQRALAAFLGRETARIDALIAKVRDALSFLNEFRTALISAAVIGKIDVPEGSSMRLEISERAFEDAIERALLRNGPDAYRDDTTGVQETAPEYGDDPLPGGYHKRQPSDYDRSLCLIPADVLDFLLATQPKEWARLKQHHGTDVKPRFLGRLSREIARRGALDVLRNGVKDSGCKFRLAYFRPSSGLNEELQRLHGANLFAVVRQLRFSEKTDQSLDLALFLNGIPIFTAELKNPLNGQDVEDAIRQYRNDRDPREPLFAYGRCLAHFAVDPEQVFVTTELVGPKTRFLPFNQGRLGGAGNPAVPPTQPGFPTDYLWEQIWARDSVLDLVRQFIHEVEAEDDRGRKTGKRFLIFPRYQQLDCVRRLVRHARNHGSGERYLIQHSAGSGKSFTIAWLAHQLSVLHDRDDRRVFDSVIVVTDRRVLDRQLQSTIRQFEQTLGVVENIDRTSRQLREALEAGRTIIVTTLQKFPVIAEQIGELPGKRFAVIVDEAHSSQSGESTKSLKTVLAAGSLEEAEREEAAAETPEEEIDERVLEEIRRRGRPPNLSTFAFTATPKPKTLELFGEKQPDGKFKPFHLYSMRQAIEEGFILDVLACYTTYKVYWRLLKKIEDDPRYDKGKAEYLLKSFVELHPHAIGEKIAICVEHFAAQVATGIGDRAKAMIVTRSRLHAVRTRLALDRYLKEKGHPWKALVAFSGTVNDRGESYTESGMNSAGQERVIGERQTAAEFEKREYRFLVVANKFQTGFDQPLLHTMYVDKKLGGVNAVQTLSRLNRTHPGKKGTMVFDFANEAEEIRKAFEPYYETTLLSEETDPNLVYEVQSRLLEFGVFLTADVEAFARAYFDPKATQDRLYAALEPARQRFSELAPDEGRDFRGQLTDYVRLYAFLAQVLTFADTDLEKLYVFARHLRRLLPADRETLPLEVQQSIDMESFRIQQTSRGRIGLERQAWPLDPAGSKARGGAGDPELEPLSRIIEALNERFGLNLGQEHRLTLEQIQLALDRDAGLDASARVNTRENVRLTFDPKVEDKIQEIVETNFELYKRITDDPTFGEALKNFLFDEYIRRHRRAEELLKLQESKTLEFKSSLRWNLKEDRKDDKRITHAVLKTIAAFLNTDGGDLLIGVDDNRKVLGIEHDRLDSDDKFTRHLTQAVRNGIGGPASTCIDPKTQIVEGKTVCLVSCRRSPEPVYLRWRGVEKAEGGDLYVRSGPGTVRLGEGDAEKYVATRFSSK